jgi:hypothetical protein
MVLSRVWLLALSVVPAGIAHTTQRNQEGRVLATRSPIWQSAVGMSTVNGFTQVANEAGSLGSEREYI